LPDPRSMVTSSAPQVYEECRIRAVLFKYDPDQFTVVLQSNRDHGIFVIPTGYPEANYVYHAALKTPSPNPLIHELTINIMSELGASFCDAVVHAYERETGSYKCYLTMTAGNRTAKANCRVTDALVLSLIAGFPLKINAQFLGAVSTGC